MKKVEKVNKPKRKILGKHITESKKVFALYAILRLLVVAVMVAQFFNGNYFFVGFYGKVT